MMATRAIFTVAAGSICVESDMQHWLRTTKLWAGDTRALMPSVDNWTRRTRVQKLHFFRHALRMGP